MDWVLLVIIIILLAWIGISLAAHQFKNTRQVESSIPPIKKSPYQKLIEEKQATWQIVQQQKDLLKRKQHLAQAYKAGDTTQIKVQKSMMTFGKSLISHMQTKAQSNPADNLKDKPIS